MKLTELFEILLKVRKRKFLTFFNQNCSTCFWFQLPNHFDDVNVFHTDNISACVQSCLDHVSISQFFEKENLPTFL